VFPLPQYLRSEGITVVEYDMIAGTTLYVDGDWIHFGINQDVHSMSLAVNVLPEEWLRVNLSTTV
jgi:hypothetical protein